MKCRYCGINPTIENSHVISKFVYRFIKKNGLPFFLNSWGEQKKVFDGLKGPYLCRFCDNEVFSYWENYFKSNVYDKMESSEATWSNTNSIKFLLSLVFRCTIHILETSPIQANATNNKLFKDLSLDSLNNIDKVGKDLFIYPHIVSPITKGDKFMVGINHLLRLSTQFVSLPAEPGLPNAFLIWIPSLILLFTDGDLTKFPENELENTKHVDAATADFINANKNMVDFLYVIFNRAVNETKSHQKSLGMWGNFLFKLDKFKSPNKLIYKAREWDRMLYLNQNQK